MPSRVLPAPPKARRYLAFCAEARRVYERLEGPHIRSARPSVPRMIRDLGPGGLATLTALGPFATLWTRLGKHFRDPRLRQLFGRYATYCGASPWLAPATLMLIAHVEQSGVWSLRGGMHALPRALARLARAARRDAALRPAVERILVRDGRACGVRAGRRARCWRPMRWSSTATPTRWRRACSARRGARAAPAVPPHRRSLSALTWAMHARTDGFPLARHNVFFCDDYRREFDDVFRRRALPHDGTVYVCAQDRGDDADAPAGRERLLCLVNAPADGDRRPFDASEIDPCLQRSLDLLQHCGLQLEPSAPRQ